MGRDGKRRALETSIGAATSSGPDGIRCRILFAYLAIAGSAPWRSSVMEKGKELWPLVGKRDRVRHYVHALEPVAD